MGDVPKTVTEISHASKVYDDLDCSTHARIGRRVIHAILPVRVPPGQ
jgi:hypothetical protein